MTAQPDIPSAGGPAQGADFAQTPIGRLRQRAQPANVILPTNRALGAEHGVLYRARRARSLARLTFAALVATSLTAVWQEPALSPPLHARMQTAALALSDLPGTFAGAQEWISSASARFDKGTEGMHISVVDLLLKLDR